MIEYDSMSDDDTSSAQERLGRNIRAALARRNLTQLDLARHLEVDPSTVSMYVRGQINVGIETIDRIAKYLGLEVDQLWTGNLDRSCTAGA